MTNNNAELVSVPREVLERVVHTLEFYAKPFGRLDEYEEPVRVPDFYSEMQFGDLAAETLGSLADLPKTPRPSDELREAAEAFRMLFVTDSEPPALIVPEQFQPDGSEDFTDAFARLDMVLREFDAAAPSAPVVSGEEELRKALRKLAIEKHAIPGHCNDIPNGGSCKLCGVEWDESQPEAHAKDCLAALSTDGGKG